MPENSFKGKVEMSVNKIFLDYIDNISNKYNISVSELILLWEGNLENLLDVLGI